MTSSETSSKENRKTFLKRLKKLSLQDRRNINYAYDLAKECHRPQKRDNGERYFEHPRKVALILIDECQLFDPNLIISALLHDTVEDTAIFADSKHHKIPNWTKTAQYRLNKTFNQQVANIVVDLTKPNINNLDVFSKAEAFNIYFQKIKSSSPETILIKMADRLHNLRCLKGTTPEKQQKTIAETKKYYLSVFKKAAAKFPHQTKYLITQINQEINNFANN